MMTRDDDISLAPDSASESAERYVRSLIYWGELGPGDKLPPATELAAQLGISRATLRVALKTLERAGFLVTTRGAHGGSRVSDTASLSRAWVQWMREHGDELDALFEFRRTIESRLAALAAERREDDDLAAIERALAREHENRQRASLFQADADIHRSIARAAHSPRLAQAMNDVRADLFLPVDLSLLDDESMVYDSHALIVKTIRERDPDGAAAAAAAHVDQILLLMRRAADRAVAGAQR
jgi:GntR family transcriptional repressor for pyruvate dehydrogenase complex